jgi:nucleoside-triphosphatase
LTDVRRHVLLTGAPGVGKTTLICNLAQRLAAFRPAGFYTREIRRNGVRQGFRLVSLDGRKQILSHVNFTSRDRVGRYKVDVPGFEQFLAEQDLLHAGTRVVILDEIGKMECLSGRFVEDVSCLLASSKIVIATVAQRGGGFIQEVKRRADADVITVTRANRVTLVESLSGTLQTKLRRGS